MVSVARGLLGRAQEAVTAAVWVGRPKAVALSPTARTTMFVALVGIGLLLEALVTGVVVHRLLVALASIMGRADPKAWGQKVAEVRANGKATAAVG